MRMKILIIGLGSPILSDDGVGLVVARALKGKIPAADVMTTPLVGLNLLDLFLDYDKLFLIDALVSENPRPGELKKLKPGEGTAHLFTSHGVDIFNLLDLGKQLGLNLPEVGAIYGIEIEVPVSFGEELSPALFQKLPSLIRFITKDIEDSLQSA
jgi:hydrogenase maturation protease